MTKQNITEPILPHCLITAVWLFFRDIKTASALQSVFCKNTDQNCSSFCDAFLQRKRSWRYRRLPTRRGLLAVCRDGKRISVLHSCYSWWGFWFLCTFYLGTLPFFLLYTFILIIFLQIKLEQDVFDRLTVLQEGLIPKKKTATDDDLHRINELIQV